MGHSRTYASCLVFGALVITPVTASGVDAGDYVGTHPVIRIGDHCAQFGEGFVDAGNGICSRVSRHVRVYVGSLNTGIGQALNTWSTTGTSSAALRSEGMVPGAEVTHLRVRGSLDSFSPFH